MFGIIAPDCRLATSGFPRYALTSSVFPRIRLAALVVLQMLRGYAGFQKQILGVVGFLFGLQRMLMLAEGCQNDGFKKRCRSIAQHLNPGL